MSEPSGNGWEEWRKYVLAELQENKTDHRTIIESLNELKTDVAKLQVKAGLWGLVAGSIPVITAILLKQF